ncbi:hypothetical protein GOBAR_DD00381 [Gossypium barbadense]|nr:hypothetical protein GOBAR_DD00381 [Gossypium barbadense]
MTKLFYKFTVSSNSIKFTEMKLLDNDDVETTVALYCPPRRLNTESIQLFVELEDAKPVDNVTQISQQYGVKDPRIEVLRSFVHDFDIDLNVGYSNQYGGRLQMHPVVIDTNALGGDGSDNNDFSNHKGEDFSDPDLDDVLDDIDDEGPDGGNNHAPSVGNPNRGIVIHNDPEAHMSIVNPDVAHASEFSEYLDIILAHLMLEDPKSKELFDQRKLDSKTISNCILEMVKDDLTITVSVLITGMQERFHYRATFYRIATLMPRMGLIQVNQINVGFMYIKNVRKAMAANSRKARTMNVQLYSRHYEMFRVIETFPTMRDVLTWEVLSPTFELVLDRNLHRKPRGHPHITRIRTDMNIRERVDTKYCGVCRSASHNRSKFSHRGYHPRESSWPNRM